MLRNVVAIGCFGLPISAWGQNVNNVPQGTSWPTIQQAIDGATAGDTLELVAASFDEEVTVDRDIVIVGNGFTTLSSPGQAVFELEADVSFELSGVVVEPVAGDLEMQGIRTIAGGNTIVISDATFRTSLPTGNGSALYAGNALEITMADVIFEGLVPGATTANVGGAIYASSSTLVPMDLTNVVFRDLTSSGTGGAIYAFNEAVTCTRCTFDHTTADEGSAISAAFMSTIDVEQSLFCGTVGSALAGIRGTVRSSRFVEINALEGAAVQPSSLAAGTWTVTNNTFVGTIGDAASSILSLVSFNEDLVSTNNLFYDNDGYAIVVGAPPVVTYNWFEANTADISGAVLDGTNRSGLPQLSSWTSDGNCDNDELWPIPLSVGGLIDAGDPSILDPDGSRSDIGAYGGPAADPALHVDADGDGVSFLQDCDDTESAAYPGAIEICDGVDNDCNGLIDGADQDISDEDTFYPDCDGDGQGDAVGAEVACFAPAGGCGTWASEAHLGALASADCNDQDPLTFFGADELCAAGDQDCDGDDDLGAVDATPFYVDEDLDGFGSEESVAVCGASGPPSGYTSTPGDCSDENSTFHPGAADSCGDGLDQDCNLVDGDDASLRDWYPDADGDGYGDGRAAPVSDCHEVLPGFSTDTTDCNDLAADVHPGAVETCNGIDDDCSSAIDDTQDCDEGTPDPNHPADQDPSSVHPVGGCNCSTPGSAALSAVSCFLVVVLSRRRDRLAS